MRTPSFSTQFKKDVKLSRKRGKDLEHLQNVLDLLVEGHILPQKYLDHRLSGNWSHHRECHIEPDWLLIYKIFDNNTRIRFERLGTHSDLFR